MNNNNKVKKKPKVIKRKLPTKKKKRLNKKSKILFFTNFLLGITISTGIAAGLFFGLKDYFIKDATAQLPVKETLVVRVKKTIPIYNKYPNINKFTDSANSAESITSVEVNSWEPTTLYHLTPDTGVKFTIMFDDVTDIKIEYLEAKTWATQDLETITYNFTNEIDVDYLKSFQKKYETFFNPPN